MLKVENVQVFGLEAAIRGMRNPLNSWSKSDSEYVIQNSEDVEFGYEPNYEYEVGEADLILMKRLAKAGTEHRKSSYAGFISVPLCVCMVCPRVFAYGYGYLYRCQGQEWKCCFRER